MTESLATRDMEFSSIPENISLVEAFVEDLKSEFNLTDELEANILVSLTEAVNNAILHGNHCDPDKKVRLKFQKQVKELIFFVEDEGVGFDKDLIKDPTAPENIDKPTGRGIFLMRNLADNIEFEEGGKKVLISFYFQS